MQRSHSIHVIPLNVLLCCRHGFIERLKSDIEKLQSKVSLPIKTDITFKVEQEITKDIAETFCDTTEQARIEFNVEYFAKSEEDRLLILLHEFIHVKHLYNSLSSWHHKRIEYVEKLERRFQEILQSAPEEMLNKLDFWKQFLPHVFRQLYEIWAELCLKEDYSEMFPKRMELEYRNLLCMFKEKKGQYQKGYGSKAKYPIFVELLRITYFRKIADEMKDIRRRFMGIQKEWKAELRKVVKEDEMKGFETLIDHLTDVSTYPGPTVLEERYFEFADKMVKN